MPKLMGLECSIQTGAGSVPLKEYGHRYGDGVVETFVAVPTKAMPFAISLKAHEYIAPGLAMFVFIDGEIQCNRNRTGMKMPGPGTSPQDYYREFLVRGSEKKDKRTGRFIQHEWLFSKLRTEKADQIRRSDKKRDTFLKNVGTVEVVILRCRGEGEAIPTPNLPQTETFDNMMKQAGAVSTPGTPVQASAKAVSVNAPSTRVTSAAGVSNGLGGLSGLFDGTSDVSGSFVISAHAIDLGLNHLDGVADDRYEHSQRHYPNQGFGQTFPKDTLPETYYRFYPDPPHYVYPGQLDDLRPQYEDPQEWRRDDRSAIHPLGISHHPPPVVETLLSTPKDKIPNMDGQTVKQHSKFSLAQSVGLDDEAKRIKQEMRDQVAAIGYPTDGAVPKAPAQLNVPPPYFPQVPHPVYYGHPPFAYPHYPLPDGKSIPLMANNFAPIPEPNLTQQKPRDSKPDLPKPFGTPTSSKLRPKSIISDSKPETPEHFYDKSADDKQKGDLHKEGGPSSGWEETGKGYTDVKDCVDGNMHERPPKFNLKDYDARRKQRAIETQHEYSKKQSEEQRGPNDVQWGWGLEEQKNREWMKDHSDGTKEHKKWDINYETDKEWANVMNKVVDDARKNQRTRGHEGTGHEIDKRGKSVEQQSINRSKGKNDVAWESNASPENRWGAQQQWTNQWSGENSPKNKRNDIKNDKQSSQEKQNTVTKTVNDDWTSRSELQPQVKKSSALNEANQNYNGPTYDEKCKSPLRNQHDGQWSTPGSRVITSESIGNRNGEDGPKTGTPRPASVKPSDQETKKPSSNASLVERESSWARKQQDPIKVQPYWTDWKQECETPDTTSRSTPREVCSYAAPSLPCIPENVEVSATHGVQVSKGSKYTHNCMRPIYIDSMENPFAVFRFRYRSKEALEKVLGRPIQDDLMKMEEQIQKEEFAAMSKEKLIEELMKAHSPARTMVTPNKPHGGNPSHADHRVNNINSRDWATLKSKKSIKSSRNGADNSRAKHTIGEWPLVSEKAAFQGGDGSGNGEWVVKSNNGKTGWENDKCSQNEQKRDNEWPNNSARSNVHGWGKNSDSQKQNDANNSWNSPVIQDSQDGWGRSKAGSRKSSKTQEHFAANDPRVQTYRSVREPPEPEGGEWEVKSAITKMDDQFGHMPW
ncbi:hypothetical protein K431DRAFT_316592 [Polychaeton citri CBS 116435]|uniref:DUF7918 domain-containing protein n=1 Tax=Polychaeton citri CBS 116435 TaxID=1314669 RepID=A0A9P4Q1K2_9PEZI|nr:hypothetical protein K431DRAFT_316592 [Polychaeton citri CBS 116435]